MSVVFTLYAQSFPPRPPVFNAQHPGRTSSIFPSSPADFAFPPDHQRGCLARSLHPPRPAVFLLLEVCSVKSHWPCYTEDQLQLEGPCLG